MSDTPTEPQVTKAERPAFDPDSVSGAIRNFTIARKGYEKSEVEKHLASVAGEVRRLVSDLDAARAEVDSLAEKAAERQAELDEAQSAVRDAAADRDAAEARASDADAARAAADAKAAAAVEAAQAATSRTLDPGEVALAAADAESRQTVETARQSATQIVADAEASAERVRQQAREDAERIVAEANDYADEQQKKIARQTVEVRDRLREEVRKARSEVTNEAEAMRARTRLDATTSDAGADARRRASSLERHAAEVLQQAQERAERILADARASRRQVLRDLDESRRRLEEHVRHLAEARSRLQRDLTSARSQVQSVLGDLDGVRMHDIDVPVLDDDLSSVLAESRLVEPESGAGANARTLPAEAVDAASELVVDAGAGEVIDLSPGGEPIDAALDVDVGREVADAVAEVVIDRGEAGAESEGGVESDLAEAEVIAFVPATSADTDPDTGAGDVADATTVADTDVDALFDRVVAQRHGESADWGYLEPETAEVVAADAAPVPVAAGALEVIEAIESAHEVGPDPDEDFAELATATADADVNTEAALDEGVVAGDVVDAATAGEPAPPAAKRDRLRAALSKLSAPTEAPADDAVTTETAEPAATAEPAESTLTADEDAPPARGRRRKKQPEAAATAATPDTVADADADADDRIEPAPGAPAAVWDLDVQANARQLRDAMARELAPKAARKIKRALQECENIVLTALRSGGDAVDAAELGATLRQGVAPILAAARARGAADAPVHLGGEPGALDLAEVGDSADPVLSVLDRWWGAFADAMQAIDDADDASRFFRVRRQGANDLASELVCTAYSMGLLSGAASLDGAGGCRLLCEAHEGCPFGEVGPAVASAPMALDESVVLPTVTDDGCRCVLLVVSDVPLTTRN